VLGVDREVTASAALEPICTWETVPGVEDGMTRVKKMARESAGVHEIVYVSATYHVVFAAGEMMVYEEIAEMQKKNTSCAFISIQKEFK
jgi:hypothetical protein